MALPALLRKLFKSSGYGSELNDGIISKTISNQDWSNSYDYPVGVVARGSDDVLYYSVAQSGPGTSAGAKDPAPGGNSGLWKSIGSGDSIPTGTVLWLSTTSVPAGYLLCNGSAVGRTTYPELFTAIGTTYGAGDGSTTFNLPNLIDKFAQGSAVAGTVKAAGLPDIEGYANIGHTGMGGAIWPGQNGALFSTGNKDSWFRYGERQTNEQQTTLGFQASKSNAIYGNSDTVQPPALTLLPCIKAFSSVVGDATAVAGQLVNDIQSKVALDGSNVSSIGAALSEYMVHAAMPSDRKVNLTLPASGRTVTAPGDGYIYLSKTSNSTYQYVDLFSLTSSGVLLLEMSETLEEGQVARLWLPVRKGQKVQINYTASGTTNQFWFIYANGAV